MCPAPTFPRHQDGLFVVQGGLGFALTLLVVRVDVRAQAREHFEGLLRGFAALEEAGLRPSTIDGVLLCRVLFHPGFAR